MFLGDLRNRKEFGLSELRVDLVGIVDGFDEVRAMATIAGHAHGQVLGMGKTRLSFVGDVAGQATFRVLCRAAMKSKNQLVGRRDLGVIAVRRLLGIGMHLARTVAGLAIHHRVVGGVAKSCVCCLAEFEELSFVARAATLASDVTI